MIMAERWGARKTPPLSTLLLSVVLNAASPREVRGQLADWWFFKVQFKSKKPFDSK